MGSGNALMAIYDDQCPNSQSGFYGAEWKDFISFDIYTVRVKDTNVITFQCNVRIYVQTDTLPLGCNSQRRRRRATNENSFRKSVTGKILTINDFLLFFEIFSGKKS